MQLYPYHSPVRFYPSKESLSDMTNPQNAQYFGNVNKPYPLEVGDFHKFLLPNYENNVDSSDLELWLIGRDEVQIACSFGFNPDMNKLLSVTFGSNEEISGHFEIKKETGETLFYSNCIKFYNSTLPNGKQYIKIASRCYFNKLGYDFENSAKDWFVTNLPAYDMGIFSIDSEFSILRKGPQKTPEIKDSYITEVSKFEFEGEGDCNVSNFIIFCSLNNELYLNGTKRTIIEKPEIDEILILSKMKFAYNKDEFGKYIPVNENEIFKGVLKPFLGNNDKTILYTYEDNNIIPI